MDRGGVPKQQGEQTPARWAQTTPSRPAKPGSTKPSYALWQNKSQTQCNLNVKKSGIIEVLEEFNYNVRTGKNFPSTRLNWEATEGKTDESDWENKTTCLASIGIVRESGERQCALVP